MIDLDWLEDRLVEVLHWQLAHPGGADDPAAPEVPAAGMRLWTIFVTLNQTRTGSGFGLNPISYQEIISFSRLYREPLRSFELDMLRALDRTFLKADADRAGKTPETTPVESRPVTKGLFDALFSVG